MSGIAALVTHTCDILRPSEGVVTDVGDPVITETPIVTGIKCRFDTGRNQSVLTGLMRAVKTAGRLYIDGGAVDDSGAALVIEEDDIIVIEGRRYQITNFIKSYTGQSFHHWEMDMEDYKNK